MSAAASIRGYAAGDDPDSKPGQMHYFVDGVEVTEAEMNVLDGGEILRMDMKGDRETLLLYGKNQNAAGLILITTKNYRDGNPYEKKIVYYLNGYEISEEEYASLKSPEINDIDVADKRSLEQYRRPDADGIFFVTTR